MCKEMSYIYYQILKRFFYQPSSNWLPLPQLVQSERKWTSGSLPTFGVENTDHLDWPYGSMKDKWRTGWSSSPRTGWSSFDISVLPHFRFSSGLLFDLCLVLRLKPTEACGQDIGASRIPKSLHCFCILDYTKLSLNTLETSYHLGFLLASSKGIHHVLQESFSPLYGRKPSHLFYMEISISYKLANATRMEDF